MAVIELVPVLEIGHPAKAWDMAGARPQQTWVSNPEGWERFLSSVNEHSGYGKLKSYPVGSGRYPVDQFSQNDIERVIELHLADLPLQESCALFGGYLLSEDNVPILLPQCCGTLADIQSWEAIVRCEKFEEFFCLEGHPAPQATSDGTVICIKCTDDDESFDGPMPTSYSIETQELANALRKAKVKLGDLTSQLNVWGSKTGHTQVERVLIYECE